MQELEKILEEIELEKKRLVFYPDCSSAFSSVQIRTIEKIEQIICKYMSNCKHMNDDWISVDERLPKEPKENPVFDDKPLELYLVDMGGSYPLRAFWNGKEFTDGWSVLKVIAWMPLPEPYRPEGSDNNDGE